MKVARLSALRTEKTEVLGENLSQCHFVINHESHGLTSNRNRASAVRSRQLTTSAAKQPKYLNRDRERNRDRQTDRQRERRGGVVTPELKLVKVSEALEDKKILQLILHREHKLSSEIPIGECCLWKQLLFILRILRIIQKASIQCVGVMQIL